MFIYNVKIGYDMKGSDLIAKIMEENGIRQVFTVVGGGAMHLNDSFGNNKNLECMYMLHEQGATIAAEGYARVNNTLPLVCVTSGPGGTNALTGVLCAWQDNIPMLVISGQVKRNSYVGNTGLKLRQYGEQEHRIVDTVTPMTKYAVMIQKPEEIRYCIEKAIYLATHGRRGPCWIDVPLDIQGMQIDEESQITYQPEKQVSGMDVNFDEVIYKLENAKCPAILAGSGIRTSGSHQKFLSMLAEWKAPVVVSRSNADIIPNNERYYYGNFGTNGGRAGNFIIQNADLLLVLGCRLSMPQIGFNYEKFSPNSYKIMVDVDSDELMKPSIHVDMPVHMDLSIFLTELENRNICFRFMEKNWLNYCDAVYREFPIYQEHHRKSKKVNPYYFAETVKEFMPDNAIGVVGNSCSCVSIKQCGVEKAMQRLWGNINCGTMGYDLPAAIGAAVAANRMVVCYAGDGSIQMNIQELQTIVNYNVPVKIFIFNNGGYRSIVLSQTNNFHRLSGCTKETGLQLPDIKKLAVAYGIPYYCCMSNADLVTTFKDVFQNSSYSICEIFEDEEQMIEPKMSSKVLDDGQIVSPSLSDLSPFLPKEIMDQYEVYGSERQYD